MHNHLPVGFPAYQEYLEKIIRQVHDSRGGDREGDRKEEGEGWHKDRPQPEPRKKGQPGDDDRRPADDLVLQSHAAA